MARFTRTIEETNHVTEIAHKLLHPRRSGVWVNLALADGSRLRGQLIGGRFSSEPEHSNPLPVLVELHILDSNGVRHEIDALDVKHVLES